MEKVCLTAVVAQLELLLPYWDEPEKHRSKNEKEKFFLKSVWEKYDIHSIDDSWWDIMVHRQTHFF